MTDILDRLAAAALDTAAARRRVPGATYRFQFRKEFRFADALALVPYLDALGVTHAYASPILKARPGSPHGYDVIDPGRLNDELGTKDDLRALAAALHARGMGLILDTVPNHMCIGADNPWWADVLEHGPSSPYADYFDIAWHDSPRPGMNGRLLLPVLGDPYGAVLESGQLRVAFDAGQFSVWYFDTRLPIDPRTYGRVLGPAAAELVTRLGVEHADTIELTSILNAVEHLPPRGEPDAVRVAMGRVETAAVKRRLGELSDRFPEAAVAVTASVDRFAGTAGDPASYGPLDDWLEAQAYRPCFWRVASDEINYRRFFDVNELAAVGTEREDVFRAVHRKLLGWLADGTADGLRIDHPDGLFDPKQYLDRLQAHYVLALAKKLAADAPADYPGFDPERDEAALLERVAEPAAKGRPLYVVVEKILADAEPLPREWACDGTTGYEFVTAVNNLFVDPAGETGLTRFYGDFTGQTDAFPTIVYEKKAQILSSSLSSELTALSHQLDRLARLDRRSRDLTLNGIRRALREVIACFPVYRSYVNGGVRDVDKALIGKAVSKARKRNPMLGRPLFDFIRDTLLLKDPPSGPASDDYRAQQKRFAGKFQQLTSPVTAKGIEDTAFYVYNRFVSLNEVGGEPGHFGWRPDKVHAFMMDRQEQSAGSLSPLSTHDTKRSEDARARLNAISELPGEWADRVNRWAHLNARHREDGDDGPVPDRNEEYLLYQTLVAVWDGGPSEEFNGRVQAFVKKALCEAKVHSSWINPDPDYEATVARFVERVLNPNESAEFLADLAAFVGRVAFLGRVTSLAQSVIRCTAPGVPDTYQGTESWDYSLVDPDNRRPVDYAARQAWLADPAAPDLADPRVKLFAVSRALRARREHTELFERGEYVPLAAIGPKADHVFAFARRHNGAAVAVVVPQLAAALVPESGRAPVGAAAWGDTAVSLDDLPPGRWTNVFTGAAIDAGRRLPLAEVLASFPVAVLTYSPRS
ncbi:malto-oligosyltrehalose synthase [Urbifossiella limnaea]|uniref:Maltooligosyl trehalose synthase n=1 Tax=Urbifossiella limnaea TaxID=2528023 RepID=A0A517XXW5_9BACT|nr:malto-oligosyltrehalose synthase [Urbifossiella limnaea]QDU22333.1 Maltooligosyl trehalose synthase [Urbifossiella limnaea]